MRPAEQIPEPTQLAQLASQVHEMFLAYVEAGFSQYQACVLLGAWLAAAGAAGTNTEG